MLVTGLTLATLTAVGFWFIFRKLPRKVRRFLQKHALFTDGTACILTYLLFGGTLTALFAAAWMGIFVSIILALTNNETTNAFLEKIAELCRSLKNKLLNYLKDYLANKESHLRLVENG